MSASLIGDLETREDVHAEFTSKDNEMTASAEELQAAEEVFLECSTATGGTSFAPQCPENTLVVCGLSANVLDYHIREIFGVYGSILSTSPETAPHHTRRGFTHAFVEFSSNEELTEAIRCMDGGQIDGKIVVVIPFLDECVADAIAGRIRKNNIPRENGIRPYQYGRHESTISRPARPPLIRERDRWQTRHADRNHSPNRFMRPPLTHDGADRGLDRNLGRYRNDIVVRRKNSINLSAIRERSSRSRREEIRRIPSLSRPRDQEAPRYPSSRGNPVITPSPARERSRSPTRRRRPSRSPSLERPVLRRRLVSTSGNRPYRDRIASPELARQVPRDNARDRKHSSPDRTSVRRRSRSRSPRAGFRYSHNRAHPVGHDVRRSSSKSSRSRSPLKVGKQDPRRGATSRRVSDSTSRSSRSPSVRADSRRRGIAVGIEKKKQCQARRVSSDSDSEPDFSSRFQKR